MSTATQSLTINAPVCLAASQSWPVAAAQSLYLNNGVSDAGAAFGLNFTGSGSIVLAANNNYPGPTNLSAGTLHIGAPAGTTTGSIAGSLNLTGGTLRSNRTDVHAPIGGVLTASAGVIQVNAATGVLTLNATNLPAASSNAFTTLTGNGGATFAVDAAPTATLSFGGSVAVLNLAIKNGAVAFTTNGGACNFLIQGGSFTAPPTDRFQLATANQTFIVTGGTANLTSGATYGFRFGGGGSPSQSGAQLVTGTQSGGTVSVAGFNMGGTDTSPTKSPSYALSGGTLTTTGGMILGADTGGTGSSTFALSGGKLKVPGSISGAQAGAKQVFALTGGTLVAATFAATNLRADVASANGTLTQSGGTLAPGDIGTAGKTAITGNYNLGAAGTLAIDLGGTTQATAFQTGQYDYVTVSGSTTLLGSLSVTIGNGFTPTNAQTFTVLNSTGAVSGSFANVAFGGRVVATDGKSSFIVSLSTNQVTLSGYVPLPDVPANLTATGGVGQIVLTWSPAANASTYSVKISATSGGPYSLLASGLASTGYIQTGLAPSQSCYYVVSGSNAAAQSPDSSETNATTATALQAWRWTNFGTVSGTGTASNTADPDHDGVANLLEYAMGTNPNSAASNGMPTLGTAAGKLTLTFTRARSDTTYTVEASSDLISWSTLATNPGTVGQSVTVSDSVNISASNPPHRFLRLRVLTP